MLHNQEKCRGKRQATTFSFVERSIGKKIYDFKESQRKGRTLARTLPSLARRIEKLTWFLLLVPLPLHSINCYVYYLCRSSWQARTVSPKMKRKNDIKIFFSSN